VKQMLANTHRRIMKMATEYMMIPSSVSKQLIEDVVLPDELDKGMDRILKHIFVHLAVGEFGEALNAIEENLKDTVNPIRGIAFASHYLQDICSPFHTSIYTIYRQGYHNTVEKQIDRHFEEWKPAFSPHPIEFTNLHETVVRLCKESELLANEFVLAFMKFELLSKEYPWDLMIKTFFRTIDVQIGFLQFVEKDGFLKKVIFPS